MTSPRIRIAALGAVAALASVALMLLAARGQNPDGPAVEAPESRSCLACHAQEVSGRRAVDSRALAAGPHRQWSCQSCHSSITAVPHTPEMMKTRASCAPCHADAAEAYRRSAHARADKVAGDHPTCVSCHAPSGDPHGVLRPAKGDRRAMAALCGNCHRQTDRMSRYGVDPDATLSYEESFHGKALLRFGMGGAAACADCHRHHDVLSPTDPAAPTHRSNAAATCAQSGCHPGARVNFAMSGANHLRLKVKQSAVLRVESAFFRYLTLGTILLLLAGVALDLRTKVFPRGPGPASGRLVASLIAASFLLLVVALASAYLGIQKGLWSGVAAVVLMGLAIGAYLMRPRRRAEPAGPPVQRLTLAQRAQHAALVVSFTLLVLTGMPLRFAHVEWLHPLYAAFGGIGGARVTHRVAAVVMIVTWVWHTLYLLWRWRQAGWSLRSWSMFPTRKDFADFWHVCRYYLGFDREGPKYDRFEFRNKFDYFAVYWGMPIMVFSGLVLWFPIYWGNRLPEVGLAAAYIAHSDESILAFLAILTWHFYNTHFNPDNFPMSQVWLTGLKTREEMERDHPLELARLDAQAQPIAIEEAPQPAPTQEPPPESA